MKMAIKAISSEPLKVSFDYLIVQEKCGKSREYYYQ